MWRWAGYHVFAVTSLSRCMQPGCSIAEKQNIHNVTRNQANQSSLTSTASNLSKRRIFTYTTTNHSIPHHSTSPPLFPPQRKIQIHTPKIFNYKISILTPYAPNLVSKKNTDPHDHVCTPLRLVRPAPPAAGNCRKKSAQFFQNNEMLRDRWMMGGWRCRMSTAGYYTGTGPAMRTRKDGRI